MVNMMACISPDDVLSNRPVGIINSPSHSEQQKTNFPQYQLMVKMMAWISPDDVLSNRPVGTIFREIRNNRKQISPNKRQLNMSSQSAKWRPFVSPLGRNQQTEGWYRDPLKIPWPLGKAVEILKVNFPTTCYVKLLSDEYHSIPLICQ